MSSPEFYQQHLDQVSRSFSFCIQRLKSPLRNYVGLSYLLCRVLDTVEDTAWQNIEAKKKAFSQFENFLTESASIEEIQRWIQSLPPIAIEAEEKLMNDAAILLKDFHALPESIRNHLRRSILNMLRGMRHFSNKEELRLNTLTEVNQYCFFVAGVVGELLTDLVRSTSAKLHFPQNFHRNAHHFGLFLQKINLLKDQKTDENEKRFLIHDRHEVLQSLYQNAKGALNYLTAIPVQEKEYRLFCAWSLFLGLASLPWIQKSFSLGVLRKIPRHATQILLGKIEKIIDDNEQLANQFKNLLPASKEIILQPKEILFDKWFFTVYEGPISHEHGREIGIA